MFRNEKGFTLIELVIVIVILGLLAAVAVPKYQDLKTEAEKAAADGVYGGAQGAAAINFASNLLGVGEPVIDDAATLLAAMDGTPAGWAVVAATDTHLRNGSYMIAITTAEDGSNKAVLSKSW